MAGILYFHIAHNTLLCLAPKFCINHCFQMLLGHCIFPRVFEFNGLCKFWGANKVYYGECEKRECVLSQDYRWPNVVFFGSVSQRNARITSPKNLFSDLVQ